MMLFKNRRLHTPGQATLSLSILIGGAAIFIGLTVAFLTLSFINSTASFQAGNRALSIASAGARDAMLRLIRDKSLPSGTYPIQLENCTACTVSITNNSALTDQAILVSEASIAGAKRKLEVLLSVNRTTGKVSVISWKQVVVTGN